jgi:ribosomal small subunit protein bTHX
MAGTGSHHAPGTTHCAILTTYRTESRRMGKGDKRTERGKLYRGTRGNTRPKPSKVRKRRKLARQQARAAGEGRPGA